MTRFLDTNILSNVSFVDAYNAAYMESRGITEVYSDDTDFDKIEGIKRVEPKGSFRVAIQPPQCSCSGGRMNSTPSSTSC